MSEPNGSSLKLPEVLPGFEHIRRFWDTKRNISMAKIQPGEFYVTTHNEAIATVLGSCICACIRDADLGVGGMNHFMLPLKGSVPEKELITTDAGRYGHWAMENLINQILKAGGRRRVLEVKIFGGSNVLKNVSSTISDQNVKFVIDYLYNENLSIKAKDVGGNLGRIVIYYPKTGLAQVKHLDDVSQYHVAEKEYQYLQKIDTKLNDGSDVELF